MTWRSNGESFSVAYDVYRNNNVVAQISNTGYPTNDYVFTHVDNDISCAGYGWFTANYYLKVRNCTAGSNKISDPTETLSINYNCLEKSGGDEKGSEVLNPGLHRGYPNPFNPTVTLPFDLKEYGFVSLRIYSVTGGLVRTLISETRSSGHHSCTWDGRDDHGRVVGAGVYLVRLEAHGTISMQKVVFLK